MITRDMMSSGKKTQPVKNMITRDMMDPIKTQIPFQEE
jgi:hypothetical protein